jgi:cysteinyl-tRNA synthetase
MRIYNTLTSKLEEFKPITPGEVKMYVCGPTVYNYAHIGNLMPPVVYDMVQRYFKYLGYKVKFVSNFTDVDDKIINSAIENNVTEKDITDKYIEAYLNDLKALNCEDIYARPRVTETMDEIIDFISLLLEKGYAYQDGSDIYFDVSKIKDYGAISKQQLDDLNTGARIEVDEHKHSPYDFVLWKDTDKGIKWDAPFGKGRPGWHTECVVMINKILGSIIDIHAGGMELKFPHHENERAQSIAANDSGLANIWMHNGLVLVNGEKMSKSLGNFILAKDLLKDYKPNAIRLVIYKSSYRTPVDFKDDILKEVSTLDEKIYNVLKQANIQIKLNNYKVNKLKHDDKINEIMDEDFNTPNLLTYQSELVKELNNQIRGNIDFSETYDKLQLVNNILGLKYDIKELTDDDVALYHKWLEKRNAKDFESADKIREELIEKNIL